jgi:hypothetical protein
MDLPNGETSGSPRYARTFVLNAGPLTEKRLPLILNQYAI